MKTCPACKTRIPLDATRCKACHTDFTDEQMAAATGEKKRSRSMTIGLVLVAIIALIAWLDRGGVESLSDYSPPVSTAP